MTRPQGLPEFGRPPLNELVLGVQFNPPHHYGLIEAGEVWKLYKNGYPSVVEQPPLEPVFETFGPPGVQQMQFQLMQVARHPRFWFLSREGEELIQFQNDRFLHNWRQTPGAVRVYPRFDTIVSKFQSEFLLLSDYFRRSSAASSSSPPMTCNQVEVTYINHIISPDGGKSYAWDFIKPLPFVKNVPDEVSMIWRKALLKPNGSPWARLTCEIQTALNQSGEKLIALNITVRGNPSIGTIGNVVDFMKASREIIVREFTDLTTDSAHAHWERM